LIGSDSADVFTQESGEKLLASIDDLGTVLSFSLKLCQLPSKRNFLITPEILYDSDQQGKIRNGNSYG